ncbi:SnoaL-like protein [Enterobacter sp. BIGb0383]|uniref:nuclear transport factor 2 family protein n=1 Tax=unclassified Enterobacter TaxID=2608935 RepID=UPI000F47F6FF|nr:MULTISPECIES: nuclear transport factor 2 family protein [unclassified Enterobacter]ROP60052.1 SnoaL-like protein [Enterobacter sp. BIGb0383]ROS08481.1 SnoaL-like protein [Enterobacter sp. BIGb0359]
MNTNRRTVLEALAIISEPAHSPERIASWFDPDYQQQVDGHVLNYAQFLIHMATLKTLTRRMTIDVKAIADNGDTVLTHHQVNVTKQDGQTSRIEVLAHFQCREGRIVRCDELTRLLTGDPADADLGQRVA